jgi:hypothetical protein
MKCMLLNCDLAKLYSSCFEHLCNTTGKSSRADADVFSRTLVAGLLLMCVFIPSLASAEIPERCYADSALHPISDNAASESEIAVLEPARDMDELLIPPTLLQYLEDQQCADTTSIATLLLTGIEIARNAGYTTPDPLLLACLAKPESKFDDGAVGHAGERGLLQIHPCHKRSMARMGLDFNNSADRVAFACVLWDGSGLRPWSTRRAAQRDHRSWSAK